MSAKITIPELLKRNKAFAATHQPIPSFQQLSELGVAMSHYAVITCADPRCNPENFLDLTMMDGVVIFRNVGGHATHAINDIVALDGFLELTDILVVHHTDCGTTHFKDADIKEGLKARLPEKKDEIDGMVFGGIDDLEQSVKDDLAILKASPLIRKELADHCVGFLYDLTTGELSSVPA